MSPGGDDYNDRLMVKGPLTMVKLKNGNMKEIRARGLAKA